MKPETIKNFMLPGEMAELDPQTPILLAFSGGADSRALLHLLATASAREGFTLFLAHVNHGIRGEEAMRDQLFCEQVAGLYGLRLFTLQADVPKLAKEWGMGMEEAARRVRYRFFAELMEQESIPILVTAHHADDNLETVLFRLCRGSGTKGLCGISPVRPFANGYLVRPMLPYSRKTILQYCHENGLDYVTDSTNTDTAYTRNRLRADVVPILEELFENPQAKVEAACSSLAEDEACLSELSEDLLQKAENEAGLLQAELKQASMAVCKRTLARWIERKTGFVPERIHLTAVLRLLEQTAQNAEIALSGDYVAIAERGLLRVMKRRLPEKIAPFSMRYGDVYLFEDGVRITVTPVSQTTKIHNLSTQSYIILQKSSAIIKSGLHWRSLEDGDRLLANGMHKKLRKLYGGVDIPSHRRGMIPVLCDDGGIVWAPFVGVRDGVTVQAEITDESEAILFSVELLS